MSSWWYELQRRNEEMSGWHDAVNRGYPTKNLTGNPLRTNFDYSEGYRIGCEVSGRKLPLKTTEDFIKYME